MSKEAEILVFIPKRLIVLWLPQLQCICSNCFGALTLQALLEVKDELQKSLGREPREAEIAEEINMSAAEVKRKIQIGRAARNKLIKVSI